MTVVIVYFGNLEAWELCSFSAILLHYFYDNTVNLFYKIILV